MNVMNFINFMNFKHFMHFMNFMNCMNFMNFVNFMNFMKLYEQVHRVHNAFMLPVQNLTQSSKNAQAALAVELEAKVPDVGSGSSKFGGAFYWGDLMT